MSSDKTRLEEHLGLNPDDLAAWAAYREHLVAEGDRRAKLIELGLAVHGGQVALRPEWWSVQKELEKAMGLGWDRGMSGSFHFSAYRLSTARGTRENLDRLLEIPQLLAPELDLREPELGAPSLLPLLERLRPSCLRLDDVGPEVERLLPLLASPVIERLEELCLSFDDELPRGAILPAVLPALIRALSASRLRRLGLWSCSLGAEGLDMLLRAEALRSLASFTLAFEREELGHGAVAELGATRLERLETLALCGCELASGALERLAASPLDGRLRHLSLWLTNAGASFWELLAGGQILPHLRVLDVDDSDFGDLQALALAHGPARPELERIAMAFTALSNQAALALLRSPSLPNLQRLSAIGDPRQLGWPALKAMGKRFLAGLPQDCGSGDWMRSLHWDGSWERR